MKIKSVKSELIIVEDPSQKMLSLLQQMREHKQKRREQMRNVPPMFTIQA